MGASGDSRLNRRSTKGKRQVSAASKQFRGFVNVDLSVAQKADFVVWRDGEGFMTAFEQFTRNGYGFSVRWEETSEAYACYMQTREEGDVNYGLVLSMRAAHPQKALERVVYVAGWILSETWEAPERTFNDGDDW